MFTRCGWEAFIKSVGPENIIKALVEEHGNEESGEKIIKALVEELGHEKVARMLERADSRGRSRRRTKPQESRR